MSALCRFRGSARKSQLKLGETNLRARTVDFFVAVVRRTTSLSQSVTKAGLWLIIASGLLSMHSTYAQEAQWIWEQTSTPAIPLGDVYFRKTVNLPAIEQARITIAADDEYELYINGRKVGTGQSVDKLDTYDVSSVITSGRNIIAARARNTAGPTAAFTARVFIKPKGDSWKVFSSDATWKTSRKLVPNWQLATLNDSDWNAAVVRGQLGTTSPWDRKAEVSTTRVEKRSRFHIKDGFSVDEILAEEDTGSLIAMAFNEFGHIIASREQGPLLLIYDSDKDKQPDKVRVYCEDVESVQGILPLNGDVFVIGMGPEGNGLYRLSDEDRNGSLEKNVKLLGFKGPMGEHGAHGLTLGPDGMIYVIVGNHSQLDRPYSASSTYRTPYEGDLITPKFEDPGGHARGIKAPGGVVIRTDIEGKDVQLVAGGIRNAYDLAFTPDGTLLIHDSDMESDIGAAWYRPTSLMMITEGAEFGWRSGWSKWPEYYVDRVPGLLDTGRGSPTGCVVYDHFQFPSNYHRNIFLADWSEGRILSVSLEPRGGGYEAHYETFLQGQPLNVTDLDVAPDGSIYFCTGGRGTAGGLYRIRWNGEIPKKVSDLGTGISKAIRQPQFSAAWSRQELANVKNEMGDAWREQVAGVAFSPENPAKYRIRALELMQLLGPVPTEEFLIDLSRSPSEMVRVKAAQLMGMSPKPDAQTRLTQMLRDSNPLVQRTACDSLLRCGATPSITDLKPLLSSSDRFVSFSARRLLEKIDPALWADEFLTSDDVRLSIQASLALMIAQPNKPNAKRVIDRTKELMAGFISDRDFIDLLRVIEVAIQRGPLAPNEVPELKTMLTAEFPAGEPKINRELIRLATFLKSEEVIPRALEYIYGDVDLGERILVAMHLPMIDHQWSSAERFALMKFFEDTASVELGSSMPLYVMNSTRDFGKSMTLEEARIFLGEGVKWPNAALASLFKMPEKLTSEDFQTLKNLDKQIDQPGFEDDRYLRLKTGITAIMARSGDVESMSYLREVWRRTPERRQPVAMGLAQQPSGDNWDYLVRSLPLLESIAAADVLSRLRQVPVATDEAEAIRNVILHGLRLEQEGEDPSMAVSLLEHWTGKEFEPLRSSESDELLGALSGWQSWYRQTYPEAAEPVLPTDIDASKWSEEQITAFLLSEDGKYGNALAGRRAFEKAQCASCHRFDSQGGNIGPDLTGITKRFTRKELIESILYPSHVVSDQYAAKRVLTVGGKIYVGIVVDNPDGSITVRRGDLTEIVVQSENIDEILPAKSSLMPTGLLDSLELSEIRDLLAYMGMVPEQKIATRPGGSAK